MSCVYKYLACQSNDNTSNIIMFIIAIHGVIGKEIG